MSEGAVNVTFRRASDDDLDRLLDLAIRTVTDTFAHSNTAENWAAFLNEHYARDKWLADIADPATTLVLGEVDGVLVAYARLRRGEAPTCIGDAGALEIEKFYVDKPFIGRGVAQLMMKHCLGHAEALGVQTVYLGVWEHNPRAVRFYEKYGFTRCGEHTFMVGDDPQVDWWMKRPVAWASSP